MESNQRQHPSHRREQLQHTYREYLSQYKSINAELSDLAWTLADLEQQITLLTGRFNEAPDSHIEQRLHDLQHWKESLEDIVLRQMDRADELSILIGELRRHLSDDSSVDDSTN
jgi:DnaJ-domain-containing protein 1